MQLYRFRVRLHRVEIVGCPKLWPRKQNAFLLALLQNALLGSPLRCARKGSECTEEAAFVTCISKVSEERRHGRPLFRRPCLWLRVRRIYRPVLSNAAVGLLSSCEFMKEVHFVWVGDVLEAGKLVPNLPCSKRQRLHTFRAHLIGP